VEVDTDEGEGEDAVNEEAEDAAAAAAEGDVAENIRGTSILIFFVATAGW